MAGGLSSAFVGEIRLWSGGVASLTGVQEVVSGWLLCNGAFVSQATYDDLFAASGHAFNGGVDPADGTFKLPDLKGRTPVGLHTSGTFTTRGAAGGVTSVQLTRTQLPPHSHSVTIDSSGAHTHTATTDVNSASHTHALSLYYGNLALNGGNTTFNFWVWPPAGYEALPFGTTSTETINHLHSVTTTSASPASHSHALTIGTTSGNPIAGDAHSNVSSYTLLHWIVKY